MKKECYHLKEKEKELVVQLTKNQCTALLLEFIIIPIKRELVLKNKSFFPLKDI